MEKILLVEDQKMFQLIVRQIFKDDQYQVTVAETAAQALSFIKEERFDLILLDIQLPDQNGLDFYRKIKELPVIEKLPVIFLTATENLDAKVTAFMLGAEDYVVKSTDPAELKARVVAKLFKNKNAAEDKEKIEIDAFVFNLPAQRVHIAKTQAPIHFTSREFKLFYLLAKNRGAVFSREKILNQIWGNEAFVSDRTIDAHIYQLRKKLGVWSACIESVPNAGYRFVPGAQPKSLRTA